jgi:hypothetical protein
MGTTFPRWKAGAMPRERVRHSGNNSWADVVVRWSKQGTDPGVIGAEGILVDLFVASRDDPGRSGSFWFEPDHPENFGAKPKVEGERAEQWGPISIDLDRQQINRLIRVLRRARDEAYGRDE